MNISITFLIAYFIASAIYGFGRISRGVLKNNITGLGILGIIIVFIFSLFALPPKQIFVNLAIWFLVLMPSAGFLMALLESIIYKTSSIRDLNTETTTNIEKIYLVEGIKKGINEGKPYYGQGAKLLEETKEGWKIVISPIQTEFLKEPKEVDEKTFIEMMLNLGVPNNKLYEFLEYKVDWDNF